MRSSGSSVLAALEALDIMDEIALPDDHPSRTGILRWLMQPESGFDPNSSLWAYLPETIDAAPHAPWWNLADLRETFEGFVINPRARVLARFLQGSAGGLLPDGRFREILADILSCAEKLVGTSSPPDTLRSLLILHERMSVSREGHEADIRQLTDVITGLIPTSVVTDPKGWTEYGLQPLEVASHPASPWFSMLKTAVGQHLDYLVTSQGSDGAWVPFWTWGTVFPEAWEDAFREWKGILTVRNLICLERFGRLAETAGP